MMRRGKFFYFTLIIAMTVIMMRCFWLATGGNAARATSVVGSRRNELLLYRTKGVIYDENMELLAGGQPCWYLIINPRDFDQENLNVILQYSKAQRSVVAEKLKKETPFTGLRPDPAKLFEKSLDQKLLNGLCPTIMK